MLPLDSQVSFSQSAPTIEARMDYETGGHLRTLGEKHLASRLLLRV